MQRSDALAPVTVGVVARFGDPAVVLERLSRIANPCAPRYRQARSAVVEAVKRQFEEAGVAIPFPQRVLATRSGATFEAAVDTPRGEATERAAGGDA